MSAFKELVERLEGRRDMNLRNGTEEGRIRASAYECALLDVAELFASLMCDKGLCVEPATWLVDVGATVLVPRCDEHCPSAGERPHQAWPCPKALR